MPSSQIIYKQKTHRIIKMGKSPSSPQQQTQWIQFHELQETPGSPLLLTSSYDSNLHAEKYIFSKELSDSEIQIYQSRRILCENVVNVYDFEVNYDVSKCVSFFATCTVITERVPYRLSMLEGLSRQQGFYVLQKAINGYQLIHRNKKSCYPSARMIGIQNDGIIKVWINENWALNSEKSAIAVTSSSSKVSELYREDCMVDQLINVVEDFVRNQEVTGFGNLFREEVLRKGKSFLELQRILQGFMMNGNMINSQQKLAARVKNYAEKKAGLKRSESDASKKDSRRSTFGFQNHGQYSQNSTDPLNLNFLRYHPHTQTTRVQLNIQPNTQKPRGVSTDRLFVSNRKETNYSQARLFSRDKTSKSLPDSSAANLCSSKERVDLPNSVNRWRHSMDQNMVYKPNSIGNMGNNFHVNLIESKTSKARCVRVDSHPCRIPVRFLNNQISEPVRPMRNRRINQCDNSYQNSMDPHYHHSNLMINHEISNQLQEKLKKTFKVSSKDPLQHFISPQPHQTHQYLSHQSQHFSRNSKRLIRSHAPSAYFVNKPSESTMTFPNRTAGTSPTDFQVRRQSTPVRFTHFNVNTPNTVSQKDGEKNQGSGSEDERIFQHGFVIKELNFQNSLYGREEEFSPLRLTLENQISRKNSPLSQQHQSGNLYQNISGQPIAVPTTPHKTQTQNGQLPIQNNSDLLLEVSSEKSPKQKQIEFQNPFSQGIASPIAPHNSNQDASQQNVTPAVSETDMESTDKYTSMFKYYLQSYGSDIIGENRQESQENSGNSHSLVESQNQVEVQGDSLDQQDFMRLNDVLDRKQEDSQGNVRGTNRKLGLPVIQEGSELQY